MVTKKLGATIIIQNEMKNEKINIKKDNGPYSECERVISFRISKKWVHLG